MNHLSLFSGIGGLDLAAHWAGMTTVAFCERDKFCQQVLAKHWPNVPIFGDIHELTANALRERGIDRIDIISGGFPCQPYSFAGKRRGDKDDRALWPQMLRVIKECRPRWIVGENVAGLISMALDGVLASLEAEGYEAWPVVFPACAVGALHIRQRVFIVANANGDSDQRKDTGGDREAAEVQRVNRAQHDTAGEFGRASNDERQRPTGAQLLPNADGQRQQQPQGSEQEKRRWIGENVANAARQSKRKPANEASALAAGGEAWNEFVGSRAHVENAERQRDRAEVERGEVGGANGQRSAGWPSGSSRWEAEPGICRVVNGVPEDVDRLRALGNAVVPQQAYPIFEAIANFEKEQPNA